MERRRVFARPVRVLSATAYIIHHRVAAAAPQSTRSGDCSARMQSLRGLRLATRVARLAAGQREAQQAAACAAQQRALGVSAFRRADAEIDLDKVQERPPPSEKLLKLSDEICNLTMLEVFDLTQILQKRLGACPRPCFRPRCTTRCSVDDVRMRGSL